MNQYDQDDGSANESKTVIIVVGSAVGAAEAAAVLRDMAQGTSGSIPYPVIDIPLRHIDRPERFDLVEVTPPDDPPWLKKYGFGSGKKRRY